MKPHTSVSRLIKCHIADLAQEATLPEGLSVDHGQDQDPEAQHGNLWDLIQGLPKGHLVLNDGWVLISQDLVQAADPKH